MSTYFVSLNINDAQYIVEEIILRGSITGELIDSYNVNAPVGTCVVKVYFFRTKNSLTMTVIFDNFAGNTRVHCTGGGGGESFFRHDLRAADDFEKVISKALTPYMVR